MSSAWFKNNFKISKSCVSYEVILKIVFVKSKKRDYDQTLKMLQLKVALFYLYIKEIYSKTMKKIHANK